MIQLPLPGSGLSTLLGGRSGDAAATGVALDTLFSGSEDAVPGLSGELQAWLMQLGPPALQRLEQLVEGGMTLPQAARTFLAEQLGRETGTALLPRPDDGPVPAERLTAVTPTPVRGDVPLSVERIAVALPEGLDPVDPKGLLQPALAAATAVAGQGQSSLAGQLPAPLAQSLLQMGVPERVGTQNWQAAVADRVMWMVQGEQQVARLKLNPPNLGPLEVRVSVHQDQTSVAFMAQHAAVREALEAALPRLREMFDQQSLQLVRADVSDPGAQQGDRAHDPGTRQPTRGDGRGADAGPEAAPNDLPMTVRAGNGLVDLFA